LQHVQTHILPQHKFIKPDAWVNKEAIVIVYRAPTVENEYHHTTDMAPIYITGCK